MNSRSIALLLCLVLTTAVGARATTILPEACGNDDVKFEVKAEKSQNVPAAPDAGMAQIVFIDSNRNSFIFRFGVDGSWVGAAQKDSYFAVNVAPGNHHLCMSVQLNGLNSETAKLREVRLLSFTAEAGKVYYFKSAYEWIEGGVVSKTFAQDSGSASAEQTMFHGSSPTIGGLIDFVQIDPEAGRFSVRSMKLSTWKIK